MKIKILPILQITWTIAFLAFALKFIADAVRSWNESPTLTSGQTKLYLIKKQYTYTNRIQFSVNFRSIESVPFPAVTVCPPNSGKWSFLVEGLSKFDTKGLIFDTIRKYNEKDDGKIMRYLFLQSIIGSTKKSKRKVLMDQFDPNLILDHSLPKRLDLLPIEKETFYLLHFACYSAGKRCIQEIIRQHTNVSKNSMDSII